ncbi:MAG: hypothetical protein KDJ19_10865 [Hyphomicrobiaceae bacterium]|nr:hypothetical protein [Hyphomicrobiaceae bacterium]MCC0025038.1 hypothetical protein [Hyphomicrobiaceae bacterium]
MAVLTVTTLDDETAATSDLATEMSDGNGLSLREALAVASTSGDKTTIKFNPALSSYGFGTGSVYLNSTLTIVSGQNVVIDGDADGDGMADVRIVGGYFFGSILEVNAGATATLQSLLLTGGNSTDIGTYGNTGADGTDGVPGGGATSYDGGDGGDGLPGTPGTSGAIVSGAIINSGTLTIRSSEINNNVGLSIGGRGGDGGDGGVGVDGSLGYGAHPEGGNGGKAGQAAAGEEGGDGGTAAGAIFNMSGGILNVINSGFVNNSGTSMGGDGGAAGDANLPGTTINASGNGGDGTDGGVGGDGKTGADGGNGGDGRFASGVIINEGTLTFGTAIGASGNNGTSTGGYGGLHGTGIGTEGYGGTSFLSAMVAPSGAPGTDGIDGSDGTSGAFDNILVSNGSSASGQVDFADTLVFLNDLQARKITEGDSGTSTLDIFVNRVGDVSENLSVAWKLVPQNGIAGDDFSGSLPVTGMVNFNAFGKQSQAISLVITGDTVAEGDNNFRIVLTAITDEPGGTSAAFGTKARNFVILDDDGGFATTNGRDVISGSALSDNIAGLDGNDRLLGNAGRDTIFGNNGKDVLRGGDHNDQLFGGAENDKLYGENGSDVLKGGKGDDLLSGARGKDELTGNSGFDEFRFTNNWGVDTILDFSKNNNEDINLHAVSAIKNFADLKANHLGKNKDGDAVISVGNNKIIIENIKMNDLDAGDFIF